MPCLNEDETLEACIVEAHAFLDRAEMQGEVLIADNGSTDGSQEIARRAGARVIDVPVRGYGAALIAGIDAAHGTYVIMGDADQSYDFSSLDPFVEALRGGADLVMGNRFRGGIDKGAMPPLHRYLGNPLLSFIGRLFFRGDIKDFHCGLRGFRRESIQTLELQSVGMEFASEMVVKSLLQKLTIVEVPTTLRKDGRSRPPHLRTWRDGWRHLRFLMLYSPRWLFFYPGIVLLALGLVLGILVESSSAKVGSVDLGVDTLVVASAFFVIGLQSIFFAFFTKIYGVNEGFLPASPKTDGARRMLRLEVGIIVGVLFVVFGATGLIMAFDRWSNAQFGSLDPVGALRTVVPSATLLVAGFQITLASLFISILDIRRKSSPHFAERGEESR
jgi:glycosyltransferase involved in cell wall biosynthesis